jgi:hypothetical protein
VVCALPLLAPPAGIGDGFASCWMKVSKLNLIRSSSESRASDSSDSVLSPESESLPEFDESLSDMTEGPLKDVAATAAEDVGVVATAAAAAMLGLGAGRSCSWWAGGERRGPSRVGILLPSGVPAGGASCK